MFSELIKSEVHEVRGQPFTFYEVGSDVWLERIMPEDDSDHAGPLGPKALAIKNTEFAAQLVACSLQPGQPDKTIDEIVGEFMKLPGTVQRELNCIAETLNGLTQLQVDAEGKDTPVEPSPAG